MLPVLVLLLAAETPPPEAALFERARANMLEMLSNQTNYVCLETIDRSERNSAKGKFATVDSLSFEVAFVEHRELYAWPGAKSFDETDLLDLAPADAAIASGAFAGHAQNLFQPGAATVYTSDWVKENAKRLGRFRFTVPAERSRYMVMRSRDHGDIIGYSGEIWIEADTALVKRIALLADATPAGLSTQTVIEYGAVRLGNGTVWLPVRSVEDIVSTAGRAERNVIRFSGCRAFTGRSTVRFDQDAPAAASPVRNVEVPADIGFEIQFNDAVDSNKLNVGDVVNAELGTDIKHRGQILFPRGSAVEVRLVRVRRRKSELEFQVALGEMNSATGTARLLAIPDVVAAERPVAEQRIGRASSDVQVLGDMKRPGLGTIYIGGIWLQLPKGYRTAWVTVASPRLAKEERH